MAAFDDLAQFRDLATRLPFFAFDAPNVGHPRISLFASTRRQADVAPIRGTLAELPFDGDFTAAVARADADLRLYELAIEQPAASLSPVEAAQTAAYGMTAIEPGPDLFALAALADSPRILDRAQRRLAEGGDPLDILVEGGRDTAALFGAIIAACMASAPVILDGAQALAAALILRHIEPRAIQHCAVPQGSTIEARAWQAGLKSVPCTDARPLYALADAIVLCREREAA